MNEMINYYAEKINFYNQKLAAADTNYERLLLNVLINEAADDLIECLKIRDNECTPSKEI